MNFKVEERRQSNWPLTMSISEGPGFKPTSQDTELNAASRTALRPIAQLDVTREEIGNAPLSHASTQGRLLYDVSMDWNELLCLATARLKSTADECRAVATLKSQGADYPERVHASVLACLEVQEQLHATLIHEHGRRRQLELEAQDAQAALTRARGELAGIKAGERRTRHLALHDTLTALPNRRFFCKRLQEALVDAERQQQPLAVLYLDLDGFKRITDAHGPDVGDEVLRTIAARLSRVRAADMASHLGGDEFACFLAGIGRRDQLSGRVNVLVNKLGAPFKIGTLLLSVRPSIGVSLYPADGATTEILLKNAGAAMYRAKLNQTRYTFFDLPIGA